MTTTLAHRVVTGLKDRILAGELPPGTRLPSESDLIEEYGVSRTVVREAVTRLRTEGLVETFQGRGSYVLSIPAPSSFTFESTAVRSQRDVLAVVDFRLGIESESAALAAQHRTATDAAAITAAMAAFTDAGREGAVEADFAFHLAIARATHNRFYVELLESLGPMVVMLPRTRLGAEFSMTDAAHVQRVQREHDNVAAAVLAGDADTARAAMRVHLGNTRRRLG